MNWSTLAILGFVAILLIMSLPPGLSLAATQTALKKDGDLQGSIYAPGGLTGVMPTLTKRAYNTPTAIPTRG